jgi:transcriptional regulator with XRE-family HTH domain
MPSHTVEELEAEIGLQIKTLRLKQNIDQATLASRAGCSLSALKNLESGNGSTLRTVIPVVRALGREDWLRNVAPMATISPLSLPKAGHTRQRARPRVIPASE